MLEEHKKTLQDFSASHNGKPLDQQALLKPNAMVAKVLVARFMSMNPQQQQSLKGILTSQTADALKILLPEMESVINKGMANATAG